MGFREDAEGRQVLSIVPRTENWTFFIAKKEAFLPRFQKVGLGFSIRSLDILRCLQYLHSGKEAYIDSAALEALGTAIPRVEIDIWHPSIPVPTSADPLGHGGNLNHSKEACRGEDQGRGRKSCECHDWHGRWSWEKETGLERNEGRECLQLEC
jgi:hypothetical protein